MILSGLESQHDSNAVAFFEGPSRAEVTPQGPESLGFPVQLTGSVSSATTVV